MGLIILAILTSLLLIYELKLNILPFTLKRTNENEIYVSLLRLSCARYSRKTTKLCAMQVNVENPEGGIKTMEPSPKYACSDLQ